MTGWQGNNLYDIHIRLVINTSLWSAVTATISVSHTVYPKIYAHGFVVLCFVVVMQSFIMNSHEVFIHIHQGCFAGTGAIVRLPQCQWSKPDGYGKTSQCITTTKHSKAKTVCIFLGIYCMFVRQSISLPWASGLPVLIQCAWNLDPSVHWNATGERIVGSQCVSSGLTVAFQWSCSVFQLCKLTLDRHWDTTGS